MKISTLALILAVLTMACADVQAQVIPMPRPKPVAADADAPVEPAQPAPAVWTEAEMAAALTARKTQLTGLDIAYEPLASLGGPDCCGAAAPVEVTRVAGVD
jgi:hypothetical protein